MTARDDTVRAAWTALPVAEAIPALRQALAGRGSAVLAAPPGSGKTTGAPLTLLDEDWLAGRRILLLEPRRIAARMAAARMASLLGEAVGDTVGYQIRMDRRVSAKTRIEVVTEGILTRRLQADPDLPGVGLVIFDEFHERSLEADLALALTLDARRQLNESLRVLVMSATLDLPRVAALLDDAPVIESGGRMYPVEVQYLPPRAGTAFEVVVADGIRHALAHTQGDVLAFLPGAREIRQVQRALGGDDNIIIRPLYGELSAVEQDLALQPDAAGRRKLIVATNLAQTSLTVEGVTAVVDGGFERAPRFDPGAGANRLDTLRISRAAAEQRAGRAGRIGPGSAFRLWSRDQHAQLPLHDLPELLAADLTRFALEIAAWGATPESLPLMDAPPAANWNYAIGLLADLGALSDGRVTPYGRELLRLPLPVRTAHMLLQARSIGQVTQAAWLAAALDERAPSTDAADFLRLLQERRAEPALQRRVEQSVAQLLRRVQAPDQASTVPANDATVGRLLAWAFPERIGRRRERQADAGEIAYLCADGGEARIRGVAGPEWLAIAHWQPDTPRKVRLAASLEMRDLLADHADRIRSIDDIRWDPRSEAVVAERQRRLGAIVLERRAIDLRNDKGAAAAARQAMIEGLRALGAEALPWTPAARAWQARVASLHAWRPEEHWPDVADTALLADAEGWLTLDGISRRDHLARLDLEVLLAARLDYGQRARLNLLAPTHMAVPSGSRVALEYDVTGAPPVLAVKLQELFGQTRTPAVDDGRRPVSLHLLSPGRKPIQVTQDLAGFWARTYVEVKKELKGRYPRHPWPDDPLAAQATARAKPRGT